MKIGFASGKLNGTGSEVKHQQQQPKELQIMDGANCITKGKPVYQVTRRSLWDLVRIA